MFQRLRWNSPDLLSLLLRREREKTLSVQRAPEKVFGVDTGLVILAFEWTTLKKLLENLKQKGRSLEPTDIREGVRIAFIRAPEDDVIEIVQRPY